MSGKIRVIGLPIEGPLTNETYLRWIREADVLAGGTRHLARFSDFKGERVPVARDMEGVLRSLSEALTNGRRIVVLGTGDPLWFGIGTTLIRHFGAEAVEVHPAVSSPQVALARLGLSMERAIVLSRHRATEKGLQRLLYFPTGVLLTGGPRGPAEVIGELLSLESSATTWEGAVCQRLGLPEEWITRGPLSELGKRKTYLTPNLLVVLNPDPRPFIQGTADFGRPDEAFAHQRGLITHSEVRAVVLSELELGCARILWDVGAGSGSVGIEAALLNPMLFVYAIERDPERIRQIAENRERFRVQNLTLHEGNITDVLLSLPPPDRVFIGGGGRDLPDFLPPLFEVLLPGGIVVAVTITTESFEALNRFSRSRSLEVEVIQLQVTRRTPLAGYHKMTPDNPITLFMFRKPS